MIDEVLAVGDIKFRMKCYRRLAKLREKGTCFILVSHNPQAILSMCQSAIYLEQGQLLAAGDVHEVMNTYEENLFSSGPELSPGAIYFSAKPESESLGLDIMSVSFKDDRGEALTVPLSGKPASLCVECRAHKPINGVNLSLMIKEQLGEGEWVLRFNAIEDDQSWDMDPGEHEIRLEFPYLGLKPGLYTMKVGLSQGPLLLLDAVESFGFAVKNTGKSISQCAFFQPRKWKVVSKQAVTTW
ncbi:MAG: Wzt carbohydrate-binding domain-containing protein [Pyrinomonadaceae bacterium]